MPLRRLLDSIESRGGFALLLAVTLTYIRDVFLSIYIFTTHVQYRSEGPDDISDALAAQVVYDELTTSVPWLAFCLVVLVYFPCRRAYGRGRDRRALGSVSSHPGLAEDVGEPPRTGEHTGATAVFSNAQLACALLAYSPAIASTLLGSKHQFDRLLESSGRDADAFNWSGSLNAAAVAAAAIFTNVGGCHHLDTGA